MTQALGIREYDGQVRGMGGFITPIVYFSQRKTKKVKKRWIQSKKIINENEALCKHIQELEEKVQNMPTSERGRCSKNKVQ